VLRNFIGLIAGVLLHYLLLIACSHLAWLLIVGKNSTGIAYKVAVVSWMLWRAFAIDPAVAVAVGTFVAGVVRRAYWWLGGVATLPLLIYVCVRDTNQFEIGSSVVYMIFAFVAALAVSRFKKTRTA
jgi:hypothetical protein